MEKDLTILIVEDDIDVCNRFIQYVNTQKDIRLVAITNNPTQAISDILYYEPDAVILDLELHNGTGSGLDVLSGLKGKLVHPFILITTNNCSQIIHEHARELGADYIFYKHQNGYSEKTAIDFLCSLKKTIKQKVHNEDVAYTTEQLMNNISRFITKELDLIEMNPKSVGYRYLIDAISIVIEKPVHNISEIVAKKYNQKGSSVERAMQNAIKVTWNHADINALLENYTGRITSNKGCPTLTEFIYYYANKIKNLYL